jgi:erythritol transport system substrate-binding protein
MAVEQAHKCVTTGSTGLEEKQLVDCELVTPENADCIENFANVC